MAYKICGTINEDATIYIIEDSGINKRLNVMTKEDEVAGDYEVQVTGSGSVHVLAVASGTGEALVYGTITLTMNNGFHAHYAEALTLQIVGLLKKYNPSFKDITAFKTFDDTSDIRTITDITINKIDYK